MKMDFYFLSVWCSKWVCSHFSVTLRFSFQQEWPVKVVLFFLFKVYNLFTFLTCIRLEFHYAFLLVEALYSFLEIVKSVFCFFIIHLNGRFPALSACILYICLKIFSTFSLCKFHLERHTFIFCFCNILLSVKSFQKSRDWVEKNIQMINIQKI